MSSEILDLIQELPEKEFLEGADIIVEGQSGGVLAVLKEGSVQVLKENVEIARVRSPGSILGEMSILLNQPHMATVRALEPTTLYIIDDPGTFIEAHPQINVAISRLLATRLNLMTNYLVDLKQQFEGEESHLGIIDEVLFNLVFHQRETE